MRVTPQVLGGHHYLIERPAFSPDGTRFVSGDLRGWLQLHARAANGTFERVAQLRVQPTYGDPQIKSVAWPALDVIATNEYQQLRTRTAGDLAVVAEHGAGGSVRLASGNGGMIATMSDTSMYLGAQPGFARSTYSAHFRRGDFEYFSVGAFAVHPSAPYVAAADDGGNDETAMAMITASGTSQVTIVNLATHEHVAIAQGAYVPDLTFDPWRDHVVTASGPGVEVWTPTGDRIQAVTATVRALAVTERYLYTSSGSALDVWDATTCAPIGSFPGHVGDWIVASPDGRTVLTQAMRADRDFRLTAWAVVD